MEGMQQTLGNSGLSLSFMASRKSGRLPAPQFPYLRCENGNAYGWGVYSKDKMCVKPLTWDTRAPQMGSDLRVPITVTAIAIHGAGPGLSLWSGLAEATGERRGGQGGAHGGMSLYHSQSSRGSLRDEGGARGPP